MDELVSVVIPCYNGEKYIKRCLDSISIQKYKNIEVVLVDDGSTDKTKEIVQEISKGYSFSIKYYEKENGGVSSARNFGFSKVNGKYILLLDIDDTIEEDYILELYNFAVENDLEIVRSGHKIVDNKGNVIEKKNYSDKNLIIGPNRYDIFLDNVYFGYAGGLFISSQLAKKVSFNMNYKFAEDLIFIRDCYSISNKIGYISSCGYNYYSNYGSATKVGNIEVRKRECLDNIKAFSSFLNYNVDKEKVYETIYYRIHLKLKYLVESTNITPNEFLEFINEINSLEEFSTIPTPNKIKFVDCNKKNKILLNLLIKKDYKLYYKIISLYKKIKKG